MVHIPSIFSKFLMSRFTKIIFFLDVPITFLVFVEAFGYNKMSKYGLPGLGKSINHETVKF